MTNVFGLIVSGRLFCELVEQYPALYDYTQQEYSNRNVQDKIWMEIGVKLNEPDEGRFLTVLNEADAVNHLCVFLTGMTPLPAGMAAMVYWSWPDPTAPPNWQLLGHISNAKPSAIFKISNLKKLHELSGENKFVSAFGTQQICHNAQIGIAIEPEANVQLHASLVAERTTNEYVSFAQKMLESLVNYVASFTVTQDQMTPTPGVAYVPMPTLHSWYQNFERRLQTNPNFWKN